jgi:flavin-dependent dehydrogenase
LTRLPLPRYDVIVVGSGPAGISTAINVIKRIPSIRDRLLVLEKKTHPREKICGGGISPYADYWLERIGLHPPIHFLELSRTRFILDRSEYAEYVIHGSGMRTVKRDEFDHALVREVLGLGIQLSQNETVISFAYGDDVVFVRTTERILDTKVLIGADGVGSIVRHGLYRYLGIGDNTNAYQAIGFLGRVNGFDSPEYGDLEAVMDFELTYGHGIRGYAWAFPIMIQHKISLNVGVCDFGTPPANGNLLRQILSEFTASRGIGIDSARLEARPIRWFHPSSLFSANRVLLVGDAAGVDPLWGEGISFSLGYGEVAASAIAHAFQSEDFSFSSYREQLLDHDLGKALMTRLQLADKLYRSPGSDNVTELFISALSHR